MQELQKTPPGAIAVDRKSAEILTALINTPPPPAEIKINMAAGGSKYLPISFVEMKLDEVFAGLWQTSNFQSQVVANEIIGSIELSVYNPVIGQWITRIGAGAVMIQQSKGSQITDIGAKIKNTLVKDYPHLKAECLKNAARSLGKMFGRDLNRELEDGYTPFSNEADIMASNVDKALSEIAAAASKEELTALYQKYKSVPGAVAAITNRRKQL